MIFLEILEYLDKTLIALLIIFLINVNKKTKKPYYNSIRKTLQTAAREVK